MGKKRRELGQLWIFSLCLSVCVSVRVYTFARQGRVTHDKTGKTSRAGVRGQGVKGRSSRSRVGPVPDPPLNLAVHDDPSPEKVVPLSLEVVERDHAPSRPYDSALSPQREGSTVSR